MLREIECSALRLDSVLVPPGGAGAVALCLGATKSDVQGRGWVRAHRCLCASGAALRPICPACTLRAVRERRLADDAAEAGPLFPAADGRRCCLKRGAVDAMRALFSDAGKAQVSGHSIRRMGA